MESTYYEDKTMRKSKMLEKFRGGRFARVCSLGHFLPFYVRYAAQYPGLMAFGWIWSTGP